jgi:benzylsuccinate CoA-transferase BbsF subunit
MPSLPLEDIRVLSLTTAAAGPTVSNFLGQYGAEIINLESRVHPDTHRGGQNKARWNTSPTFVKLHRNKKSITINMGTEAGRSIAKELVAVSDVIVENFTLGVLQRWGLDYPNVKDIKEDIVMLSLRGLGSTGPRAADTTWGPNLTALFGMTYLWNYVDAPYPTAEARAQHPDFLSGCSGAFAIMAALLHRKLTGKGQHIDGSQIEAGASLLGPVYLDYLINGRVQAPQGNQKSGASPHEAYRCHGDDAWCVIVVETDQDWARFCEALGGMSWVTDPKFSTVLGRMANRGELDGKITEWTINRSSQEVMGIMQSYGVISGPVQDVQDIFESDLQFKETGFLVGFEEPEAGMVITEGLAATLSETPGGIRSPAPLLGEHTWEICRDLLGMSAEEFERLETEQILF